MKFRDTTNEEVARAGVTNLCNTSLVRPVPLKRTWILPTPVQIQVQSFNSLRLSH